MRDVDSYCESAFTTYMEQQHSSLAVRTLIFYHDALVSQKLFKEGARVLLRGQSAMVHDCFEVDDDVYVRGMCTVTHCFMNKPHSVMHVFRYRK